MAKTLVVGDLHLKSYDVLPRVEEILDAPANAAEAAQQLNDLLAENTSSSRRALFSRGVVQG